MIDVIAMWTMPLSHVRSLLSHTELYETTSLCTAMVAVDMLLRLDRQTHNSSSNIAGEYKQEQATLRRQQQLALHVKA